MKLKISLLLFLLSFFLLHKIDRKHIFFYTCLGLNHYTNFEHKKSESNHYYAHFSNKHKQEIHQGLVNTQADMVVCCEQITEKREKKSETSDYGFFNIALHTIYVSSRNILHITPIFDYDVKTYIRIYVLNNVFRI